MPALDMMYKTVAQIVLLYRSKKLGSEGGDNEGDGGITPSVGPEDIWDIILASQGGGIGVFIGGGGLGDDGAVENEGVHLEAEG